MILATAICPQMSIGLYYLHFAQHLALYGEDDGVDYHEEENRLALFARFACEHPWCQSFVLMLDTTADVIDAYEGESLRFDDAEWFEGDKHGWLIGRCRDRGRAMDALRELAPDPRSRRLVESWNQAIQPLMREMGDWVERPRGRPCKARLELVS